jgi:hypothetical protein
MSWDGIAFGSIEVTGNTTAETTTDATPRKIAAFDTDGEYNRVTSAAASDQLEIDEAGTYRITGHISFSGTLSKTFVVSAAVDGTPVGTPLERKLGTGGDLGAASFCATAVLSVGALITAYHHSTDGGSAFTAKHLALCIVRVK